MWKNVLVWGFWSESLWATRSNLTTKWFWMASNRLILVSLSMLGLVSGYCSIVGNLITWTFRNIWRENNMTRKLRDSLYVDNLKSDLITTINVQNNNYSEAMFWSSNHYCFRVSSSGSTSFVQSSIHTMPSRRCENIFLVTVYIISCVSVYFNIVD